MKEQIVGTSAERAALRSLLDAYAESAGVNDAPDWREKLGTWSVFAAAAGASLALTTSATADIIYSGPQNLTAGPYGVSCYPECKKGRNINIDGQGNSFAIVVAYGAPGFSHRASDRVSLLNGRCLTFGSGDCYSRTVVGARQILGNSGNVRRLASGAAISNGLTGFGANNLLRLLKKVCTTSGAFCATTSSRGTWPDANNTGFAGVKFTEGGLTHFGWVRLKFGENAKGPNSITAIDWAYNDVAGAPILAGQTSSIPEPSNKALALLSAGSVALLAWRRRRRALTSKKTDADPSSD
jgi:hypothetical protein